MVPTSARNGVSKGSSRYRARPPWETGLAASLLLYRRDPIHTTLALAHMHPLLKYQPDSHRLTALGDW